MPTSPPRVPLTERQNQILRLVQMGHSNKEVARTLSISEGTVKQHLLEVYRRLNVTNRTMAAAVGRHGEAESLFLPTSVGNPEPARGKPAASATSMPPPPAFPRFTAAMLPVTVLRVVVQASESLVNILGSRGFARFNHLLREVCGQESRRFGSTIQGVPDGLLLLFGVPHLREDDPERAACCAARIFERTRELWQEEREGMEFPVHIALASGDLVQNSDGDTTTLHGALLQRGHEALPTPEPGQAGEIAPVRVDAPTRLALQTLARRYGPIPLPLPVTDADGAQKSDPPFLGRGAELATLHSRHDLLLQGEARAMVLLGEAGFGKSRLVGVLREACSHTLNLRWLGGVCRAAGRHFPWHPILPILENLAGCDESKQPLPARRARLQEWIATLPPTLAATGAFLLAAHATTDTATTSQPTPEQLGNVADFMVAVVRAQKVATVLFLDNLQWADSATQALLPLLVERFNGTPVWLLAAGRKAELRQTSCVAGMDPLPLPKLSTRYLADMLRQLLPTGFAPDSVLFQLARFCRGVPLFAVAVADHVRQNANPATLDTLDETLLFPPMLRGLILERLQDAGIDWRTARAIAASGKVILSQLLALDLHPDPATTRAAVARMVQVGLLDTSGMGSGQTLTFTNGMVRAAIWHTLPAGDRAPEKEPRGNAPAP
ncbi:MAG: AAA family ATPase [Magnetococcales bacterium]|nr:AAA family ATPase [Magnetococcales bacterium]